MLAALRATMVIQWNFISTEAPAGEGVPIRFRFGIHDFVPLDPKRPSNIKLNKLKTIYWNQE
jgi:hypothetical protein